MYQNCLLFHLLLFNFCDQFSILLGRWYHTKWNKFFFTLFCDGCRSFATAIRIADINIYTTQYENKTENSCHQPLYKKKKKWNDEAIVEVYRRLSFGKKSWKPYVLIFFLVDVHTFQLSSISSFQHLHPSVVLTYFFEPPTSLPSIYAP